MAPPDPPPSSTTTGPKAARVITSTVAAASGQHLPHSPRSASGNSSPAPGQTSAAQRARQLSRQGSAEQSVLVGPGVAPNPTPTVVPSTFPETEEDIDFGFGFSADTPKGVEQDSEMREATPGPLLSYSTTPRPSREPTVEPQLSAPAGSLPEGAEYPAVAPVEVNFTWPHAQTEFSWDEDDAFAAIRRYASGLSSFIRSGSDDFRARVARYTTDEFSANEFDRMASSSWFPAAEACRDVFLAMLEAGGNIAIPRILGGVVETSIIQALQEGQAQQRRLLEENMRLKDGLEEQRIVTTQFQENFDNIGRGLTTEFGRIKDQLALIRTNGLEMNTTVDGSARTVASINSTLKAVAGRVDSIAQGPGGFAAAALMSP